MNFSLNTTEGQRIVWAFQRMLMQLMNPSKG